MARLGASAYNNGSGVRITSVGSGADDGWTEVIRLKGSTLPNGTNEYCFVVFGIMGSPVVPGNLAGTPVQMEVCLGSATARFPFHKTAMTFADGLLNNLLRARPFMFVRNYRTGGVGGNRGNWNAADDLVVWARIYANGVSPGSVGGSFDVANITVLAFSVAAIGTSNLHSYFDNNASNNNLQAEGFKQLSGLTSTSVFGNGEQWIFFGSVQYQPGTAGPFVAPFLQFTHTPDGTLGGQEALIGGVRHGLTPLLVHTTPLQRDTFQTGGWGVFDTTTASELGLRGYDQHAVSAGRTRYLSSEGFAIKTSVFGAWWNALQLPNAGLGLDLIYDDWGQALNVESIEPNIPYFSNFQFLGQCMWDTVARRAGRSYSLQMGSNLVAPFPVNFQQRWVYTRDWTEGVYNHLGFALLLPPQVVQEKWYALGYPPEAAGGRNDPGRDFCVLGWSWDPAVNYTPSGPAVPPTVVVVPQREALDLSSLTALPIEPDIGYHEEIGAHQHVFRPDYGTPLTWPAFTTTRRPFRLEWRGLSRADRDTVFAMLRAQASRAFKWTTPDVTVPIALVLVGNPESVDVGRSVFTVTVNALELIYLGT